MTEFVSFDFTTIEPQKAPPPPAPIAFHWSSAARTAVPQVSPKMAMVVAETVRARIERDTFVTLQLRVS
jgi:hypothetical protein